ncbi:MAG: FAD:protein FMN transferase [Deltaproteobacteria bacterium]|nr:FAD:protein FMN transferase [Deltaproteobacteria bacterium]
MRWPVALIAVAALPSCRDRRDEPPPVEVPPALVAKAVHGSFHAMGTSIEIEVWTDREIAARGAMDDALAEIRRLESLMTTWSEGSDISRVNAAAGGAAVPVSDEVLEVLAASRRVHDESGGVFDVTFQALHHLWRFDHDAAAEIPPDDAITARLPLIDGKRVELDRAAKTARLPVKGMAINVGGIAKGYVVDKAAAVLARHGFGDVLVQAGGDLLARGRKGGEPWRVGIRDPRGAPGDFFAFAPVRDAAFSTAGDYERAFVRAGARYHHILDPRTGKPATACRSVTVLAPDAFTADQLDDAIFILGPSEGLKLLASHPGVGAVVVDKDNVVHVSEGLKGVVEIVHPPTPGI